MIVTLRLRCDDRQHFLDWAVANGLLNITEPDRWGRTEHWAPTLSVYEIGPVVTTPAVLDTSTWPPTVVTPAVIDSHHHVDLRIWNEALIEMVPTQVTGEGGQTITVDVPHCTLQGGTGVEVVTPSTPMHEWC